MHAFFWCTLMTIVVTQSDNWCTSDEFINEPVAACSCNFWHPFLNGLFMNSASGHWSCDGSTLCLKKNRFCCKSYQHNEKSVGWYANYPYCVPAWCTHFQRYRYPAYQSKDAPFAKLPRWDTHYDKSGMFDNDATAQLTCNSLIPILM